MAKLTKAEKKRRAREVRKLLGFYVSFQDARIRADYPDAEARAARALSLAMTELHELWRLENPEKATL